MKKEFEDKAMPPLPVDAQKWEPDLEREENLEHYNFNPPQKIHDKQRAMIPTPFGTVDAEIVQELSAHEQQNIHAAQMHQQAIEDDFTDLRSIDDVPGAGQEYEAHLKEDDHYRQSIKDRFNHLRERNLARER